MCALYKKGPAALPQNYRSIALLNGVAKIWHGHLRRSIGNHVLAGYDPLQLGGRPGVPVGFAVAAFRSAIDLCAHHGRCTAILFVDIQAAYYESSRDLLFHGDRGGMLPQDSYLQHLAPLVASLLDQGALTLLGVPQEEVDLLQDCVAISHWCLSGAANLFMARRGSRPGDGLADILFGALFAIALRHIRQVCHDEGWGHMSGGSFIGRDDEALQLGWADDLAELADFGSPDELACVFPRLATVVLSTLRHLRFRVNLGAGKTEGMVIVRGAGAKRVRGEMLSGDSTISLPTGDSLRLTPEYKYLGVVQTPRDTGRRDLDVSAQRAHAAWAHARGLLSSPSLPWALKRAWIAGRVLPAAYATLATSLAVSSRAMAPLTGFFERATRSLLASWHYGHLLTRPTLFVLAGLSAPEHAVVIARVRLVNQLVSKSPASVWTLFDAAWNRDTTWCQLLVDACRQVLPAIRSPQGTAVTHCTIQAVRTHSSQLHQACKYLSRWGTAQAALCQLWIDVATPRHRAVIGLALPQVCHVCGVTLPSKHALSAHIHRKHSVVSSYTRLTHGTVCLWCHTEQHSTDRLKYHLRTSTGCLHGLRVTVGEVYEYGTGTKRTGRRRHVGLPAIRLPGPVNATPAQRAAAAAGRPCTEDDLSRELLQATGTACVHEWSTGGPTRDPSQTAPPAENAALPPLQTVAPSHNLGSSALR